MSTCKLGVRNKPWKLFILCWFWELCKTCYFIGLFNIRQNDYELNNFNWVGYNLPDCLLFRQTNW